VPLQAGIYILVATPASGYFGQAPMYSFSDVNTATGCGSRYAVEGVRFQRVQLDITKMGRLSQATRTAIAQLMTQTDGASLSRLRNWIAHICFGTEEVAGFVPDPFARPNNQSPYLAYGAVDALVASGALTTADVPLALLYWTVQGVQFLDRWSVRRRPVPPLLTTTWPLPFSRRRHAEAEADFLQFQEQVQALLASTANQAARAAMRAVDFFRYLPPAGMIPLAGFGSASGFDSLQFFAGHTTRGPVFIEGILLEPLLRESVCYLPIDLNDQQMVWLYAVRENMQSVAASPIDRPAASLVFATGHIPYNGNPHFDLSRWDFGNFALVP